MKTTYPIISFVLLLVAFVSCKKEPSQGLPPDLVLTKADSVLISNTKGLLNDGSSVADTHTILFDTIHEKRIILTQDAYVYVTFLYEGATWENSLGYYTYNLSDSPSIANKTILFPNISGAGGGGALESGDLVQLGTTKIPKGTVIGLFLVAQGWKDGHIMPGIYTNYSDKKFNINYLQQSALFVEKKTGMLVLGFEDMAASGGDYNDVVVSVSDSKDPTVKPTSFDLAKVPEL